MMGKFFALVALGCKARLIERRGFSALLPRADFPLANQMLA